jgi:hypothetical protein
VNIAKQFNAGAIVLSLTSWEAKVGEKAPTCVNTASRGCQGNDVIDYTEY